MNAQTRPATAPHRSTAAAPVTAASATRPPATVAGRPVRTVGPGQALHLGRLGGELTVLSGSIWLTCRGDAGDHRLQSGERMLLAVDDQAVIESWDLGRTASVGWKPRHRSFMAAVLAEPLRVLAFLAGRLAAGCAAAAGRAAASARWAEGHIEPSGEKAPAPSPGRSCR